MERLYTCRFCGREFDNHPPPYGDEWSEDWKDHSVKIRGLEGDQGDAECGPIVEVDINTPCPHDPRPPF